jgi:hypothetical protein
MPSEAAWPLAHQGWRCRAAWLQCTMPLPARRWAVGPRVMLSPAGRKGHSSGRRRRRRGRRHHLKATTQPARRLSRRTLRATQEPPGRRARGSHRRRRPPRRRGPSWCHTLLLAQPAAAREVLQRVAAAAADRHGNGALLEGASPEGARRGSGWPWCKYVCAWVRACVHMGVQVLDTHKFLGTTDGRSHHATPPRHTSASAAIITQRASEHLSWCRTHRYPCRAQEIASVSRTLST